MARVVTVLTGLGRLTEVQGGGSGAAPPSAAPAAAAAPPPPTAQSAAAASQNGECAGSEIEMIESVDAPPFPLLGLTLTAAHHDQYFVKSAHECDVSEKAED